MWKKMAMISIEEYKLLKGLDDYWKWRWIARDESGELYRHEKKPKKFEVEWVSERGYYLYLGKETFQFIQWEDSEPYNIQELIEEYEDESEEAEVKKDIDWLKGEMDSMHRMRDLDRNPDEWFISKTALLKAIDQLDGSEVLSEYWIEQKSIDTHVDTLSGDVQVTFRLDDLQNIIVPKQELPVIPKFVADWVESRDYYNVYEVLQDLSAPGSPHASKDVRDWIFRNQENVEKFVRAWLDDYEVEEEQKYVVRLDDDSYLQRYEIDNKNIVTPFRVVGHLKEVAIKFDNRKKAEMVAELVEGKAEEMEE